MAEIATMELEHYIEETKESTEKKVVVLLSGGVDSTTLLYDMVHRGYDCFPLSMDYGQRHVEELTSAKLITRQLGLEGRWVVANLKSLQDLLPSALTGKGEVPDGHYTDAIMSKTVVPNRNMIMLSIAGGYASGLGASFVVYAAHTGDHVIYPDCRPEFIEACGEALFKGCGVSLMAPFQRMSKADIVKLGARLGVPYELTWSCYKGLDKQCGLCGTDIERRLAFIEAGVSDPTVYENPLPERYK